MKTLTGVHSDTANTISFEHEELRLHSRRAILGASLIPSCRLVRNRRAQSEQKSLSLEFCVSEVELSFPKLVITMHSVWLSD